MINVFGGVNFINDTGKLFAGNCGNKFDLIIDQISNDFLVYRHQINLLLAPHGQAGAFVNLDDCDYVRLIFTPTD